MTRIVRNLLQVIKTYNFRQTIPNIRTYGLKTFLENAFDVISGREAVGSKLPIDDRFESKSDFFNFLMALNNSKDKEYVTYLLQDAPKTDIKLIAFYLPQFHPIPENDAWWGKGFTEWTNVTKAIPQYIGHYQPKLPGELGFYDLRVPEVQKRQVELARQYGIHGFCFHFYWFNGRTVLEKPLEQFLSNRESDFPFCINWANENWTRRWDGLDKDILLEQKYSSEDDVAFIEYISKYLKDERYIKINSKPLLIVYRPSLLPDPKATAKRWREWCGNNGIGEIFLALTHSFEHIKPGKIEHVNPSEIGFDAAIEFAPNTFPLRDITNQFDMVNNKYAGRIGDYTSALELAKEYKKPPYKKFRGICPAWDNEARRTGRGFTLANSSPDAYREWLKIICDYTLKNFAAEEKLIFVNAWNEWAEGAYLEPDRRYGYAYLQATADALLEINSCGSDESGKNDLVSQVGIVKKRHDTAVILHLYYPDLWDGIYALLANLDGDFDLFISVPFDVDFSTQDILKQHLDTYILRCKNRGRDIAPFFTVFSVIYPLQYKYVLKIHTKRSPHRRDGDIWRNDLLSKLIGSRKLVQEVKDTLDARPEVAIIAPQGHVVHSSSFLESNADYIKRLAEKINIRYDEDFIFVAGSMFWLRPSAFKKLLPLSLAPNDFEPEKGQLDGTLAHAIERFFGLLTLSSGLTIIEIGVEGKIREVLSQTKYRFVSKDSGYSE